MFLLCANTDEVRELYPAGPQANPRGDTGVDLCFPIDGEVSGGETVMLDLGVRAVWLGPGGGPRAFFLMARSSLARTPLMLVNGVGLIDPGYRGTLKAAVWNRAPTPYRYSRGDSLFQVAAADLSTAEFEVLPPGDVRIATLFGATVRGAGGFGSTGARGGAPPPGEGGGQRGALGAGPQGRLALN